MARLTAAQRDALPNSAFAGPGRSYPIEDPAHARNALARASQHASPALQAKIRRKVGKKYPGMGKSSARHQMIAKFVKRHE